MTVSLAQSLLALIKETPGWWARRIQVRLLWVAEGSHQPMRVGPPDHTWCSRCRATWPCAAWTRIDGQLAELREGR